VRRARRLPALAATLVLMAITGACASVDVPEEIPAPTTTEAPPVEAPPAQPDCGDPTASLRPTGPATADVPPGSYMDQIRQNQSLRVGVDVGTLRFSAIDPLTGDIDGFDVDIAREVAGALFGLPPDQTEEVVDLVGIPSSERVSALTEGRVDMVVDVFTINCERREEIAFSSEYFTAGQRVLLRADDPAASVADLADRTICVSEGSTAIANLQDAGLPLEAITTRPQRADCLVAVQQGQVDAMATDDAILAGMAAQDPNLRLVGEPFSTEPYGIGLPLEQDEWVRYVNAVLEDVRSSGRWVELYDRWLADVLGDDSGPPAATYED
jgi:polar amino acid transport system substrate-binding protein